LAPCDINLTIAAMKDHSDTFTTHTHIMTSVKMA
jgi:hypothetical protein